MSKSSDAIKATVEACQVLVAELAAGHIPAPTLPDNTQLQNVRYAPHFVAGLRTDGPPYLSNDIAFYLGNASRDDKAPAVISVALMLLELMEQGQLDEEDLARIYAGGPSLSVTALRRRLSSLFRNGGTAREVLFNS